jgi:hypothetical protein
MPFIKGFSVDFNAFLLNFYIICSINCLHDRTSRLFCLFRIILMPRKYLASLRLDNSNLEANFSLTVLIFSISYKNINISLIWAIITVFSLYVYIEGLLFRLLQSIFSNISYRYSCHWRADYFSPYKALFSLQTRPFSCLKPIGCWIYISSLIGALGKADLTSQWWISQLK